MLRLFQGIEPTFSPQLVSIGEYSGQLIVGVQIGDKGHRMIGWGVDGERIQLFGGRMMIGTSLFEGSEHLQQCPQDACTPTYQDSLLQRDSADETSRRAVICPRRIGRDACVLTPSDIPLLRCCRQLPSDRQADAQESRHLGAELRRAPFARAVDKALDTLSADGDEVLDSVVGPLGNFCRFRSPAE